MKKLILLALLAIVMVGCSPKITDEGIVVLIEENPKFVESSKKYKVGLSSKSNLSADTRVYFYTNDLYQIGDTIKITKKN